MNGKAEEAGQIEMDVKETEAILQHLNQATLGEVDCRWIDRKMDDIHRSFSSFTCRLFLQFYPIPISLTYLR